MTKDEIDTLWQKAMQESIKYGEMFTRYHFAKMVAEAENKECAKVADGYIGADPIAAAIRARRTHEST